MHSHHPVEASPQHPQWASAQAKLRAGENVVAPLEVDLDSQCRFAQGLLILTQQRVLAWDPASDVWSEWALAPGLSLKLSDHGGIGSLELLDPTRRLALWRFTLAVNVQAQRWL
ncbi:ABC transporter, partial [Roseateles sp. GG27B]